MGFKLNTKPEVLLWYKWLYWTKGISSREFKREYMNDINDVMEINNAISEKQMREAQLQKLISRVK